jgi:hypothetical protein
VKRGLIIRTDWATWGVSRMNSGANERLTADAMIRNPITPAAPVQNVRHSFVRRVWASARSSVTRLTGCQLIACGRVASAADIRFSKVEA